MNQKRRSNTGQASLSAVLLVTVGFLFSAGCASSAAQATGEKHARYAVELLLAVDKKVFPSRAVELLNLDAERLKFLPEGKCIELTRARFSLDTTRMTLFTKADLLVSEAELTASRLKAQNAQPGPTDFAAGQPMHDIAEKLMQADVIRHSAGSQELFDREVAVALASDKCATDAFYEAEQAGEILQNAFLLKVIDRDGARLKRLMETVDMRPALSAEESFNARLAETRKKAPDAEAARTSAEVRRKNVVTAELRQSRAKLSGALRTLAAGRK